MNPNDVYDSWLITIIMMGANETYTGREYLRRIAHHLWDDYEGAMGCSKPKLCRMKRK